MKIAGSAKLSYLSFRDAKQIIIFVCVKDKKKKSKKAYIPLIKTIMNYRKSDFMADLPAGIMVAILLVPQSIAYAYLAGMPPQYGLYAALIPCIIYAVLGTSPHLSIGPVAVSSLLVLAGVSQLAPPFSDAYIQYVIIAGFMIGLLQFILGAARLGNLINLLSYPVITGFTSAAAIIVMVNQLKDIFGLRIPIGEYLYETIYYIWTHLSEAHKATFLLAAVTLLLIIAIKRLSKKIPYGLVVVVLSIICSYYFDFASRGIAVIADVPSGLPSFGSPQITYPCIVDLIPTVLIVTFIGIIEAVGIAKAIGNKHNWYRVDANQELRALGLSKIGGSFFNALPTSGSFSRSALLNESGARTTVASLITVIFVVAALLFLTPSLYHLPKVVLAVIIVFAVSGLFEYRYARSLARTNRRDLMTMLVTFLFTIAINIETGIALGFITSLIVVMTCSRSPFRSLQNILLLKSKTGIRYQKSGTIGIITVNQTLNFGNAQHLKYLSKLVTRKEEGLSSLILDIRKMADIDSVGLKVVSTAIAEAKKHDIKIIISVANATVTRRLAHIYQSDLVDLPEDNITAV